MGKKNSKVYAPRRKTSTISPPPSTGLFKALPTPIPASVECFVQAICPFRRPEPSVLCPQLRRSSQIIWIRALVPGEIEYFFAGLVACPSIDA